MKKLLKLLNFLRFPMRPRPKYKSGGQAYTIMGRPSAGSCFTIYEEVQVKIVDVFWSDKGWTYNVRFEFWGMKSGKNYPESVLTPYRTKRTATSYDCNC